MVKRKLVLLTFFAFFIIQIDGFAQDIALNEEAKTLTYDALYDSPYEINRLFVHLQPMYGELFTTNVTVGWGVKGQYYLHDIADFEAHVRTPYARGFDLNRDAAYKNGTVDNEARPFIYMELLGTYHIKDFEQDTETKFILYSKRYKGDKWAATVPMHTIIPTKVRKIFGARIGGMSYNTSLDMNKIMERQNVVLVSSEGTPIDADESVYGNMSATGFYIGGSMSIIKNVAVQPDKVYGTLVNDMIFTTFFDVNYTPMVAIDDIYIDGEKYASEPVQKSMLGFRAGMEGKFNRKFGMAYSGEIGFRPGLKDSGFFILAKISFPVFSTQLKNNVESFGK